MYFKIFQAFSCSYNPSKNSIEERRKEYLALIVSIEYFKKKYLLLCLFEKKVPIWLPIIEIRLLVEKGQYN
jgi:hypothetical protein